MTSEEKSIRECEIIYALKSNKNEQKDALGMLAFILVLVAAAIVVMI